MSIFSNTNFWPFRHLILRVCVTYTYDRNELEELLEISPDFSPVLFFIIFNASANNALAVLSAPADGPCTIRG